MKPIMQQKNNSKVKFNNLTIINNYNAPAYDKISKQRLLYLILSIIFVALVVLTKLL
jgi:hypothetical protein